MSETIIKEASTIAEALQALSNDFGVPEEQIEYTVLQEPGKKLFGMGSEKPARVEGWVADGENDEAGAVVREILQVEEEAGAAPPSSIEVLIEEDDSEEFTDEQLDMVADAGVAALKEILLSFGKESGEVTIEEYEGDEGEIILDIVGDDLAVLIGRHGKTLDALQTVVALIVARRVGFRYPLIVDVEGYKHRRRQKLESIAHSAASRAVRQNSSVRLKAMTPYERRIVHMALRGDDRVFTESEGEEPNRIVVIKPQR